MANLNIRQGARNSLNGAPDWNVQIDRAKKDLQTQIDTLKNYTKLTTIYNTSLYTNSPAALTTSLSGTDNGAKNMFNTEVVPIFDTDEPIPTDWFNVSSVSSPYYGILQYKGGDSISVIVDVTFTATTPASGGDPLKGGDITANLYLAEAAVGTFVPVNTPFATDQYKCKDGLPLLLSCYPLARKHTGHARYKLNINTMDQLMVKLNTDNTADTAGCSVYQAKINIMRMKT